MKKKMKSIVDKILDPRHFKTSIYLHGAAIKAFDNGHYLESAIIYFQLVEFSLRLAIHLLSIRMGLSESVMKRMEDEQSFYRLVLYLDLIKPDNNLSKRLLDFNGLRNDFMHELFYSFKSFDSLKKNLIEFCLEGKELTHHLLVMIGLREDK